MTGTCTQKKELLHYSDWADDMRTGFFRAWKSGQNVYIDKGSLCPRGYINIHNYILPNRLDDSASFASKLMIKFQFHQNTLIFSWSTIFDG